MYGVKFLPSYFGYYLAGEINVTILETLYYNNYVHINYGVHNDSKKSPSGFDILDGMGIGTRTWYSTMNARNTAFSSYGVFCRRHITFLVLIARLHMELV